MPSFLTNLLALPAKTKALLGVSAFAILAIAFLLLRIATAPTYALLSTGLDPAQTGKITAALDAQGIAYELRGNGTSLAVQKSAVSQARIALATAGVQGGGGSQPGYELFDKTKLGASQFQQQVTYQRALEGEIARTLSGVDGVSDPSVQLVLPQDDLFQDSATPATAAVMLQNSADSLQPGAVRGIAQLTASSVKGLKSENVTITDGSGQLLWPSGDGSAGATGGSTKQAAEARYSRQLETSLNALLARTLGPNKAQVQVNADLNVDKVSQKALTYAKKGTPLTTSVATEKLKGGTVTTGGTAGTGSNIPSYSAGGAGGGANSNYQSSKKSTDWGVDKKVTSTEVAPGTVNKLNVALLVDKSVPGPVFKQLQSTVAAAAGVNTAARRQHHGRADGVRQGHGAEGGPGPGDAARPAQVGRPRPRQPAVPVLHDARPAQARGRQPRHAELADRDRGADDARAARAQHVGAPRSTAPRRRCSRPGRRTPTCQQLDQLMEREPERVAAQVKAWMAED